MLIAPALRPEPGLLFLAGGGRTPPELVDRFVAECGPTGRIVVLPLASEIPDGSGSIALLKEHGARNVVPFAVASPKRTDLDGLERTLAGAKGIWMPGGVQGRIVERLGLAWGRRVIGARVRAGMHAYGTSAGAMVLSRTMIAGPGAAKDTALTAPGLGMTGWVVDTHFRERGREPRLRDALRISGRTRGLGISERSWCVVRGNEVLETHGDVTRVEL